MRFDDELLDDRVEQRGDARGHDRVEYPSVASALKTPTPPRALTAAAHARHDYATATAEQVHEAARIVAAEFVPFYDAHRARIPRGFTAQPPP